MINIVEWTNWNRGLQDKIEDQSIDQKAVSAELNFLTMGDKMELRRGMKGLGGYLTGSGKITGLTVGRRADGTEIPFRTRARKLEYYDSATDAWIEIGSDALEAAASGEDITMDSYHSLAGDFVYLGSPNSHLRKIHVASPGTALDQDNPTTNFQGKIKVKRYAMFLWDRGGTAISDKSQVYRSKLDKDEYSDYTQIGSENVGVGDGAVKTFTGTLDFKDKLIENCEDAWNESVDGDVTSVLDTADYKVGSGSVKLTVAVGASAGDILATEAISSVNLINARKVKLWIKSSVATAAGNLQLLLDDTANCASPLESLDIPALVPNTWTPLELTLATPANLAGVISVGIKMVVDLGAFVLHLDEIRTDGSRRTCFQVQINDTVETFADNKNGVMVGSLGGTGTINYATGAFSVTFITAPTIGQTIIASYRWEDASINGICDFTFAGTRGATDGFILPQNDAGNMETIATFNNVEYCIHEFKTYAVTISADDLTLTNLLFRSRVGIPNWRAAAETGDGIYYVDDTDQNDPKLRILTIGATGIDVVPLSISDQVNLSNYRFDAAATIEWGDYIVWACRTSNSLTNNRVLVYHKIWKSIDVLDYYVSCFAILNGTLLGGDSVTNNVFVLFSGIDDDDSTIAASAETKLDTLGLPQYLKKMKRVQIQGAIGPEQIIGVYAALDRGGYSKIGQIRGDGDYVDRSQAVTIGSVTLGHGEIGGGSDGILAYNYVKEFAVRLDKFLQIKIKFLVEVDEDTNVSGIGYFSFSTIRWCDIRKKERKLPRKYRFVSTDTESSESVDGAGNTTN